LLEERRTLELRSILPQPLIQMTELLINSPDAPPPPPPGKQPLSIVVAAGPFTTSEDLFYVPLQAILDYCGTHKPDVLLLAGPLVDVENPLLRSGLHDETFEEVHALRVEARLAEFLQRPGCTTQVVVLPSVRDAHHQPVFPQAPLDSAEISNLHMLANPAVFCCNEVVMGCSTADWLMASAKEELSRSQKQVERLPALAAHIALQRSFYPLFPALLGFPLDTARSAAMELPCTPDVLITPSDLAPFAKVVAADCGNVLCINPGRLTKGISGNDGSCLPLAIHVLSSGALRRIYIVSFE
jgi:DNA polymerase alpha subunit B